MLAELPDATAAASALARVAAAGAGTVSTAVLLTVDEMLEALRLGVGVGYRAPGAEPAAG